MRRTKLIATLGPASSDVETVAKLIEVGVDVFRLNFSHGTLDAHERTLSAVRTAAAKLGATVAIMGDLCGPKIRLNRIANGHVELATGARVRFVRGDAPGTADALSCNYPRLIDDLRTGHRLLIDDGLVRLRVEDRRDDALHCVVEVGGVVSDRKGINLPDTPLDMPALTDKDAVDLDWALRHDVDYVALSFVRSAADVTSLRERIRAAGSDCRIVSKIEKPQALDHLSEIIEASDVLLVARGDLGVEMPIERVPLLQKDMVRRCRYAGTPCIIATQMLQSMVTNAVPTRAEVSDVANAILDGADALMLSAETATGQHPIEAVRTLVNVARQTEAHQHRLARAAEGDVLAAALRRTSAVARAAAVVARDLDAALIAVWSETGNTVRLLSKHRPPQPIVGLCSDERICRRMAMYFGVTPLRLDRSSDDARMAADLDAALTGRGLAHGADLTVVVADTRTLQPGVSNALLIHVVGQRDSVSKERS